MVAVRTGIFAAAARAAAPIYGKYAKLGAPALGDAAPLDFRSGNYGVSFTSGGLLFPYQLGASCVLYDAGILKSDVPVAGASSGGLAAVVGALSEAPGAPPLTDYLDAALRINDFTRGATSGWGKLYPALRAETDRLLDDESAATLNARAAPVTLAVTRLAPLPQPQFVSSFEGRDDLAATLHATAAIPFYFGGLTQPFLMHRGAPAVDGHFASPRRFFGAPETNAAATLRVCPFPAGVVGLEAPHVICPAEGNLRELMSCALCDPPAPDAYLRGLFDSGCRDAEAYLKNGASKMS